MSSFLSIRTLLNTTLALAILGQQTICASSLLDQKAQALRLATQAPGVSVAVFSTHEMDQGVAGIRKLGSAPVIGRDDQFHLGSLIKAMTSLTISTMVESGQLAWDAKLKDLLPELLPTMRIEYQNKTLLDLLTHRAGIIGVLDRPAVLELPIFNGSPTQQRVEFAAWALQREPDIAPGADAQYSNGGLAIAAAIAEKVSNQSYETLLSNKVLAPLGIPARFNWPAIGTAATLLSQPWGHTFDDGAFIPNDPNAPENQFPLMLNPAGNIAMTLPEYIRTARLYLAGLRGQCQIVTPSTYQFLNTPQSSLGLSPAWFVTDIAGEPTSTFSGSAGTFWVYVAIQPRLNKGVVVAVNAVNETAEFVQQISDAGDELLALPALSFATDGFESCR